MMNLYSMLYRIASTSTPEGIHAEATKRGVPWDNNDAFMGQCEQLVGKRHLDDMAPGELQVVYTALHDGKFDGLIKP